MFLVCPKCLNASASIRKAAGFGCDVCGHAWEAPAPQMGDAYYRRLEDLEASLVANGGERLLLRDFPVVLGRDSEFEALQQNLAISRRHFQIDSSEERLSVTDLGSRGGTYINGKEVSADRPSTVHAGDSLRVAGVELQISIQLKQSPVDGSDYRPGPESVRLDAETGRITVGGMRSNADVLLPLADEECIAACFFRGEQGSWRVLAFHSKGMAVNGRSFLEHSLVTGDEITIGKFRYAYEADGAQLRPCQPVQGLGLSASGIVFSVDTRHGRKRILSDVAVDIPAGKLTAIIGTSGSGKSTLVKILGGALHADSGTIHVNGQEVALERLHEKIAGIVGFVPQEDIVHDELSVRETLNYAASLRLRQDATAGGRREVVSRVLKDLNLLEHQDKFANQLSGGQRKRLNVAVELINSPSLLFLDEPTTGLDTASERELVQCLLRLAHQGRTVVLITHSLEILGSADHVVFMADDGTGGRVLMQGGAREAKSQYGIANWKDLFERDHPARHRKAPSQILAGNTLSRLSSGLPQVVTLFLRLVNLWAATPATTVFSLVGLPFILGLLTRVALPLDGSTGTDRMLFGVICALWLGMNQTVREIVKERRIMLRESFAGVSCVSYLFSKLVFFIIVGAVQSAVLVAPMVWLRVKGFSVHLDLADMACPITVLWLMFWLALSVGSSLGLFISAVCLFLRTKGEVVAVLLVVLVMLPQILFSEKVLGTLALEDADYRSFVITDESSVAAEAASYLTASRYLYLPLKAVNLSKAEIPAIFTFNVTILLAFITICMVLSWITLELFWLRQKKATHW